MFFPLSVLIIDIQAPARAEYERKEFSMDNYISLPHIVTHVKVGDFTLDVYAYRHLNSDECKLAVSQYLRQCKLKKLPLNGHGKIFTQFGSTPEDEL